MTGLGKLEFLVNISSRCEISCLVEYFIIIGLDDTQHDSLHETCHINVTRGWDKRMGLFSLKIFSSFLWYECYEYEQPEMVDIYFTCDMCDNIFECNWFLLMHMKHYKT